MKLHPLCELFPPMDEEDFARLVEDIRQNGLIEPIIVYEGDTILDGRNRFAACQEAGVKPVFAEFVGQDPVAFVFSKNLSRRHLNESQRAMLGTRLATLRPGRPDRSEALSVSQQVAGDTVRVSTRTIRKAKRVLDSGDANLINSVESGKVSVSLAAKIAKLPPEQREAVLNENRPDHAVKKVIRRQKEEALATKILELPDMQFGVIYADPAWRFDTFSENGKDRSAENHYPTQGTDEIIGFDVGSISADDAVLFMWATAPMIEDALSVMSAWGFTYKSQCVWIKDRIGTGYWFRNQHEILLVGTRGKVPAPAPGTQWPSVIDAEVEEHSVKPDIFYELIEQYYPNLPKIELNARRSRRGWARFGLEAPEAA